MSLAPEPLSTDAYYWEIQRADGAGLATSSHDRTHQRGGVSIEPDPSFAPDELVLMDTMVGSTLEVTGALTSTGLSSRDLAAGRWTSAQFRLAVGDWRSEQAPELLCAGELGVISLGDSSFQAEVVVTPSRLRDQACPQTSPECRAQLGDRQCRVSLRTGRIRTEVVSQNGQQIFVGESDLEQFRYGRLRWTTGANAGLDHVIIETGPGMLTLIEDPPLGVVPGDRVLLTEGCDGRLQTCSQRFGNVENFRGEPHLPGTDILTRYPGD